MLIRCKSCEVNANKFGQEYNVQKTLARCSDLSLKCCITRLDVGVLQTCFESVLISVFCPHTFSSWICTGLHSQGILEN